MSQEAETPKKNALHLKLDAARKEATLLNTDESKVTKAALDSVITKVEAAQKAPKQKNVPLTDAEVVDVIQATSKEYQKAIDAFQDAANKATSEDARKACETKIAAIELEKSVLASYLPEQMSEAEIRVHVQAILEQLALTDPKQAGKVVGVFNQHHPKMAEGKVVMRIAQELLSV